MQRSNEFIANPNAAIATMMEETNCTAVAASFSDIHLDSEDEATDERLMKFLPSEDDMKMDENRSSGNQNQKRYMKRISDDVDYNDIEDFPPNPNFEDLQYRFNYASHKRLTMRLSRGNNNIHENIDKTHLNNGLSQPKRRKYMKRNVADDTSISYCDLEIIDGAAHEKKANKLTDVSLALADPHADIKFQKNLGVHCRPINLLQAERYFISKDTHCKEKQHRGESTQANDTPMRKVNEVPPLA